MNFTSYDHLYPDVVCQPFSTSFRFCFFLGFFTNELGHYLTLMSFRVAHFTNFTCFLLRNPLWKRRVEHFAQGRQITEENGRVWPLQSRLRPSQKGQKQQVGGGFEYLCSILLVIIHSTCNFSYLNMDKPDIVILCPTGGCSNLYHRCYMNLPPL